MHITENSKDNAYVFKSYQPGSIHIDTHVFNECVLLEPQQFTNIDLPAVNELSLTNIEPLLQQYPHTELLFIGTGAHHQTLNTELVTHTHQKAIAIEALASHLLPAIHMILMEENRNFLMLVYP